MLEFVRNIWERIVSFLADYDIQKISDVVRQLEWREQLTNPLAWLIALAVLVYVLWKKRVSLLILFCSFVAFVFLLQNTLPPPGQSIPLNKVLEFLGGSMLLVAINVYFLIIRDK